MLRGLSRQQEKRAKGPGHMAGWARTPAAMDCETWATFLAPGCPSLLLAICCGCPGVNQQMGAPCVSDSPIKI